MTSSLDWSKQKERSWLESSLAVSGTIFSARMTRSMTAKQLEKPRFRLDIRKHCYTIRVIDIWNNLPLEIRNSNSIHTFKKNVKKYLMTKQWTKSVIIMYYIAIVHKSVIFAINWMKWNEMFGNVCQLERWLCTY